MATTHSALRDRLLTAWRSAGVAAAAGVATGTWSSTSSPRVLEGNAGGGLLGPVHRGRSPLVELWQESGSWLLSSYDGGPEETTWTVRVHSAVRTAGDAQVRAEAILAAGLTALRAAHLTFFPVGRDIVSDLDQAPLGFALVLTFRVVNTFAGTSFGGDVAATGGADAGLPASPITTHATLRRALLAAWRRSTVAGVAGVEAAAWASTSAPRVLFGQSGFVGPRHRGRTPLVELFQTAGSYWQRSADGGPQEQEWTARLWSGARRPAEAENALRAIAAIGLAETRAVTRTLWGERAESGALRTGPLGHFLDVRFSIQARFAAADFNHEVDDTPVAADALLLEDGTELLLEDGTAVLLES